MTKVSLNEEVVDPDDIEMLEDLIMAATNEALRKVEEETNAVMSKLTGGLSWYGWRISVLMDYYSSHITKLIEELSKLPGVGAKSAQTPGVSYYQPSDRGSAAALGYDHRCKEERQILQRMFYADRSMSSARSARTMQETTRRSWSWKIQEIWRRTRRPASMTVSTMFCTGQFHRCSASDRGTSN